MNSGQSLAASPYGAGLPFLGNQGALPQAQLLIQVHLDLPFGSTSYGCRQQFLWCRHISPTGIVFLPGE